MTDSEPDSQSDPTPDSEHSPAAPRLLTPAEAAAATGLAKKVITGRMDRGTLRVVRDESGTRRTGLLDASHPAKSGVESPGHPGESAGESQGHPGELVVWQTAYEREREERVEAQAQAQEMRDQLIAIANAGPIRALRLRRQLRAMSTTDASPAPSSGP